MSVEDLGPRRSSAGGLLRVKGKEEEETGFFSDSTQAAPTRFRILGRRLVTSVDFPGGFLTQRRPVSSHHEQSKRGWAVSPHER